LKNIGKIYLSLGSLLLMLILHDSFCGPDFSMENNGPGSLDYFGSDTHVNVSWGKLLSDLINEDDNFSIVKSKQTYNVLSKGILLEF
jgi:hypothetical protein